MTEQIPQDWAHEFRGRRNPHCAKCGDERGGPYGHESSECQFRPNYARVRRDMEQAAQRLKDDPTLGGLLRAD